MSYSLFLDDIRTIGMVYPDRSENDFVIVRTFDAFREVILSHGLRISSALITIWD
jgi:hypothetical protein